MAGVVMGWAFVGDALGGGRPIPADGEWHDARIARKRRCMVVAETLLDALDSANGATICRVECAARRHQIVWRVDASEMLSDFARRCAWDVIGLWTPPPVVEDYLRCGGDASQKKAARDAAWAAARAAAWDAAEDAAWAAARAATNDAAWAATRAAANDAARAAAWAAAKDAANDAANDAAWSAAWDAALAATRAAQNVDLTEMVDAVHAGTYTRWIASGRSN